MTTRSLCIRLAVLTALLLAGGLLLADGDLEERFPAKPGEKLTIQLESGGNIDIEGWDRDEVLVQARIVGPVGTDIRRTSDGVRIVASAQHRKGERTSVRLSVRVPGRFDIDIESRGGSVEIDGIEGEIRGETMGGELVLQNLRGSLDFETFGGNVKLLDSDVDGRVTSLGGNLYLKNVNGNVEASTAGGNVTYDNVTPRSGACDEVRISTMGGNIHVPDAGCGADVETMGGNIVIDRAENHVKAETMGGNVTVNSVDGWVRASTMGGNVTVTMVGNPRTGRRDVSLTSMGGDITLTVPDGLSMDVDITLTYTKRSKQKYEIRSEFPLHIDKTEQWDHQSRQPRRYIYGKGTLDGGEHKIKIETVNGDVYLRRGN